MEACELRLIAVESFSLFPSFSLCMLACVNACKWVSMRVCVWMERTLVVLPLLRQEQSDFQG